MCLHGALENEWHYHTHFANNTTAYLQGTFPHLTKTSEFVDTNPSIQNLALRICRFHNSVTALQKYKDKI